MLHTFTTTTHVKGKPDVIVTCTAEIDDTLSAACKRYPRLGTEADAVARLVKAAVIPAQDAIRRKVRSGNVKGDAAAQKVFDSFMQGEPTGAVPKWETALRDSLHKAGLDKATSDKVVSKERDRRKAK